MSKGSIHSGDTPTFVADAAMVQYTLVKLDSTENQVTEAAANTDEAVGIVQRAVDNAGEHVAVKVDGFSFVEAAGTIAIGDKLTPTTAGKAIKTTTATHHVFGVALSAGNSGDRVEVKLYPVGTVGSAVGL